MTAISVSERLLEMAAFYTPLALTVTDMDADMRPLAEQTIHKLHNMTDAAFEEAQFTMTLSDTE